MNDLFYNQGCGRFRIHRHGGRTGVLPLRTEEEQAHVKVEKCNNWKIEEVDHLIHVHYTLLEEKHVEYLYASRIR
ncbi:MAG: hypothetical protein WCZ43_12400 [Proteiniphilum sp.]